MTKKGLILIDLGQFEDENPLLSSQHAYSEFLEQENTYLKEIQKGHCVRIATTHNKCLTYCMEKIGARDAAGKIEKYEAGIEFLIFLAAATPSPIHKLATQTALEN